MKLVEDISKQVIKWVFLINLPVIIIVILFLEQILDIFFGQEYIAAANPLRLLAIGMFFISFSEIGRSLLSTAGKSKVILANLLISSSLLIILSIILIKPYGATGAALANMISNFMLTILFFIFVYRYLSMVPFEKKILSLLIIALIPTIILIILRSFFPKNIVGFILQVVFFSLLYLFLIMTTKCLDEKSIMILKSIKNRIRGRKQS